MRKTGLLIMLLSFLYLIIYAVSHGLNEYYDLASNIQVALIFGTPCLVAAALSWFWPHRGSIASVVIAAILLALSTIALLTSKVPAPGQQWPVISISEMAGNIVPYLILLCGSVLAFIAVARNDTRDLLPVINTGNARADRLCKTGLIVMLASGLIGTLTFTAIIGLSGDSAPAANIFSGLMLGATFAIIPLILATITWRWPYRGSMVAIALSSVWLIFVTANAVNNMMQLPWITDRIVYPSVIVLLVGSCLVFNSAKEMTDCNVSTSLG